MNKFVRASLTQTCWSGTNCSSSSSPSRSLCCFPIKSLMVVETGSMRRRLLDFYPVWAGPGRSHQIMCLNKHFFTVRNEPDFVPCSVSVPSISPTDRGDIRGALTHTQSSAGLWNQNWVFKLYRKKKKFKYLFLTTS